MATTRIMPLHIGKGRTESRAISEIIDYVANTEMPDGFPNRWSIKSLVRLADALNCSVDYLLCRTDDPHGSQGGAAAPAGGGWVPATTPPPQYSHVLADFDLGDGNPYRVECRFDGTDYLMRGTKVDMTPIRWLLIPPVEDAANG